MKAQLLSLIFIAACIVARADDSHKAALKEVRVLGDTKNGLGERMIVRELRVEGASDNTYFGVHYYRFEFYSLGTLYDAITTWDMSEPGKVTIEWSGDKQCEISLIDGWFHVTYDRSKRDQPWKFARRID